MSDIFLSYKSEDKAKAQIIAEALGRNGYSVWWDQVIPIGRTFDEIIEKELDASKCVVVLWSGKSVKSKWVITEAGEGDSRRILIPVLIEKVKPPLAFRRMEAAELIDWDGTSDNEEFDLLLDSISEILGHSPAVKNELKKPKIEERKENKTKEMPEKLKKQEENAEEARIKIENSKRSETNIEQNNFTNSIGIEFTLIPAGEFMMGSPPSENDGRDNERPVHRVNIANDFYISKNVVTQKQWRELMGENPKYRQAFLYFKGENLPVSPITCFEVQEFIEKLNEKENTNKYRLPSEAEWEYAARAGTTTTYSFGDHELYLDAYAWYETNSNKKLHDVGQKEHNPWGLFDMHGNVWEWVQDNWNGNYKDAPTDGSAWKSNNSNRVIRGGSWSSSAGDCRSSRRTYSRPGEAGLQTNTGFRLVREIQ